MITINTKNVLLVFFLFALGTAAYYHYNPAYQNDQELIKKSFPQWIIYGRFGSKGPFRITHKSPIYPSGTGFDFYVLNETRKTKHQYEGIVGYDFRVLELKDNNGKQVILVLRTKDKTLTFK
ncbi:MAG: hypothetical protein Q8Q33_06610 [Chlamydiota bacterium]|nr:hypothetical protein [Chlamydiota bacterium]